MYFKMIKATVLYLCVVTFIVKRASAISGSGVDDVEEDSKCIAVKNISFLESVYSTMDRHRAIDLAMCTSNCMEISDRKFFYGAGPTELNSCTEACVHGILNRTDCNNYCENECETIDEIKTYSVNTRKCNIQPCLDGCLNMSFLVQDTKEMPSSVEPNIELHLVPHTSSPKLVINETWTEDNVSTDVIVFEVHDAEYNSKFYFIQQIFINVLSVDYFSCKNIEVSYAFANKHGISNFSQKASLIMPGVTPPQAPEIFNYSLVYDSRPNFFGHYVLNMSWINPQDIEPVEFFEIHLQNLLPEFIHNQCKSEVFGPINPVQDDLMYSTVYAKDSSRQPFAGCIYRLKVVSVPKYFKQFHSASSDSKVITTEDYSPPNVTAFCSRSLGDDHKFSVLIQLIIDSYIAEESLLQRIEIIPKLMKKDHVQNIFALIEKPVIGNRTKLQYVIGGFPPTSDSDSLYSFSVTMYWKEDLMYQPEVLSAFCQVSALSPQPGTVENLVLIKKPVKLSFSKISLSYKWDSPKINGEFDYYEFCLGSGLLYGDEDQKTGFVCSKLHKFNTSYTWNTSFFPEENLHCLNLQIRVKNQHVLGNWSDPVLIPIDNTCISTSPIVQTQHATSSTSSFVSSRTQQATSNTNSSVASRHIDIINRSQQATSNTSSSVALNSSRIPIPAVQRQVDTELAVIISIVIGGAFFLITIMVMFLIIGLHRYLKRRKRRLELIHEDLVGNGVFQMGPRIQFTLELAFDEWEIPSSQIIISGTLGQGAFGEVFKGTIVEPIPNPRMKNLLKQSCDHFVAIKLLKSSATGNEKTDFLKEIDLMKIISEGNSPHVVNMVGCVTAQEPLCLITEFMKHGDLLTYLRTNRKQAFESMTNPYPGLDDLTSIDLLSFAYQIASGMEFLGEIGIVHRDLACRNILLGDGKSIKISDFGMARIIGQNEDDVYIKTTKGRLPLKWMAIESITDRQFTVASDVWSYGVTLWEIATLGGFPYPTIENEELLVRLKKGYRMECPENCASEIYDIMLECWKGKPKERPKFSVLRKRFDSLLSAQQKNLYIDLQTDESKEIYTDIGEANSFHNSENPSPVATRLKKMCLSPAMKLSKSLSPSPSIFSRKSVDDECLKITNPWVRDGYNPETLSLSPGSNAIMFEGGQTHLGRPTSLSIWEGNWRRENLYVDEPAGVPNVLIQISTSSPSSPERKKSIN